MSKAIFVVGCPRSGTTLAQELVGAHSDVFSCRETHFFHRIRRDGRRKLLDHLFLSRARVLSAYQFICSNVDLAVAHDPGRVITMKDAAVFFEGLMSSEARARGRSAWVEKSPENLEYIRWISSDIPEAIFIHVLRDGRDVVASLIDAARRFPQRWSEYSDLGTAIKAYNKALALSMKYHGKQGHIFLQYEHVLEDFDATCCKLYNALGLQAEAVDLKFTRLHETLVRKDEGWKTDYQGRIANTRLVKFSEVLAAEERRSVTSGVTLWVPEGGAADI